MDLGLPHVGRNLDVRDRDVLDPRVAQIGEDRHADHFANGFGGFLNAAGCHEEQGAGSRERGFRRRFS